MSILEHRNCPICSSCKSGLVFDQKFSTLIGESNEFFDQKIWICETCGMVSVRDYLCPEDLGAYYSSMSNYEYPANDYDFPEYDKRKAHRQYDWLSQFGHFVKVLDIGCSLAYTLNLFSKDGSEVLGVEPSEKLKNIAKEKYGVDVITGFISGDTKLPGNQSLIILSHIVEHLFEPLSLLKNLHAHLAEEGMVFIEVPTIEEFDERDLFQFSFEHINYFSHGSLSNLMHCAGFEEVDHVIFENDDGTAPFYPTLGSLWRKSTQEYPLINRYPHDFKVISRYVDLVKSNSVIFNDRISSVLTNHTNVAIWGAGTLTAQLLAQTPLGTAKIKYIYDSDPKKDGLVMHEIPVKKPYLSSALLQDDGVDVVVIGSWSSQEEIYQTLLIYLDPNCIVRLF